MRYLEVSKHEPSLKSLAPHKSIGFFFPLLYQTIMVILSGLWESSIFLVNSIDLAYFRKLSLSKWKLGLAPLPF